MLATGSHADAAQIPLINFGERLKLWRVSYNEGNMRGQCVLTDGVLKVGWRSVLRKGTRRRNCNQFWHGDCVKWWKELPLAKEVLIVNGIGSDLQRWSKDKGTEWVKIVLHIKGEEMTPTSERICAYYMPTSCHLSVGLLISVFNQHLVCGRSQVDDDLWFFTS